MTKKIVINTCFGGFSLSPKAIKRISELKGKECYFFKWLIKTDKFELIKIEDIEGVRFTCFSVPNPEDYLPKEKINKDGTYKRYNEAYTKIYISSYDFERDDLYLIKVVEELGEEANGDYAKLKIVEIPNDVEWEIDEYDGNETIDEVHRSWN